VGWPSVRRQHQLDPFRRRVDKDKVSNDGRANSTLRSPGENAKVRSYWADRLIIREAENGLGQKRKEEQRFIGGLAEFQKRFAEAQTEFQKKTAEWQVEATEKNLTRATAERKKAEEEKANVVAEAAKKGFKAEDLKKQEGTVSK
jgi:membrane protein involved in colicin uptake